MFHIDLAFYSLLKATGAQMAKYMQENFAYDFQMYPAQRYVKDQCILFMQHIMWNCSRNTMTVQELREGLENLHSLLYILSTKDIAAFRVKWGNGRVAGYCLPLS